MTTNAIIQLAAASSHQPFIALFSFFALFAIAACGRGVPPSPSADVDAYQRALRATDPAKMGTPKPGSAAERKGVERFIEFYKDFTTEPVKRLVRGVYAKDVHFRDPWKAAEGIDAVEEYFVGSTEAVEECSFEIENWVGGEGEYYFRWVMKLRTKRWPDDVFRGIGATHIRFNEDGEVSFHQDYWDTGGILYEQFPVIGGVLRWIRGRM